jgi:methyl-accepting chemotaxis protein
MVSQRVTRRRSENPRSGQWNVGAGQPAAATPFARFLWIFATLGIVVVIVVIGFLIGIVRALESIDDGLSTASNSVAGATANVQPLPDYIRGINSALSDIDSALKPIPGQVAGINDSLQSIRGAAQRIDGSLRDTSQSLIDTSGSLANTSGTLSGVDRSLGTSSTSPDGHLHRNGEAAPHRLDDR